MSRVSNVASVHGLFGTFVVPVRGSGIYSVLVQVAGFPGRFNLDSLSCRPGPFVSSVNPTTGLPNAAITLRGVRFSNSSTVNFGTVPAASVT